MMPRQLWLMDVLADEFRGSRGFQVDYYPGWQTRGSPSFYPEGAMEHHTGSGTYPALLRYMAEGPVHPPLCNVANSRPTSIRGIQTVRITVIAAGRANHAGKGELPWRRGQGNTGNRHTFGDEGQNTGSQAWPQQQVEAQRRMDAAILAHLKKDPDPFLLDHKTYTPRKGDRVGRHIGTERAAVREIIRIGKQPSKPALNDVEEFLMTLPDDQAKALRDLAKNPHLVTRLITLANTLNSDTAALRQGEFGRAMAEDVESGHRAGWGRSVLNQLIITHRAMTAAQFERDTDFKVVVDLRRGLEEMGSNAFSYARAGVALWREAGARSWKQSWDRFKENRAYDETDLA